MLPAQNEKKSVVAEIIFRTLRNKIYKYMAEIFTTVYIHKLDVIVNKYNKVIDAKSSANIDFDVENNNKDPKFKVDDHVGISKYNGIFVKFYKQSW